MGFNVAKTIFKLIETQVLFNTIWVYTFLNLFFAVTKGRVQLKILVVFDTKTRGGGGQLLTILWFSNRGQANY